MPPFIPIETIRNQPVFAKKYVNVFSSVAGDGDAGLLRLSFLRARLRRFASPQNLPAGPVERHVNSFSPQCVRKIRSPPESETSARAAAPRAIAYSYRHRTPPAALRLIHARPIRPRKRSQSRKSKRAVMQASKTCKLMLINRDSYYTTSFRGGCYHWTFGPAK